MKTKTKKKAATAESKKKATTIGKLFDLMSNESVVVSVKYYSDEEAPDQGYVGFYFMPYLLEDCGDEFRIDDMSWPKSTKVRVLEDGTAVAKAHDHTYLFRFYNLLQMSPNGPFFDRGLEQWRWFRSE